MVTEYMSVCEVLDMDPKMEDVFLKHDLNCAGCPGNVRETIKEAAEGHSINLELLLEDINNLLKK